MSDTAYDRVIDALRAHDRLVKDNGHGKAMAQCPAHDDSRPSLSIGLRRDGDGVVMCCQAGCTNADIVAALDMTMSELFDNAGMRAAYSDNTTYVYPGGRKVHRKPGKDFPQSGNKTDTTLFRADRIGDATTVYVAEGEKDVLAVEAVGGVAVCSAMGAGKAHKADWSPLRGRNVIIVADKDQPGRAHAMQIAGLLDGIAKSVRIAEAAVGKDAADHIEADLPLDELVAVERPSLEEKPVGDAPTIYGCAHEFEPPTAPFSVAQQMYRLSKYLDDDGARTLVDWRGNWMSWRRTHWSELDTSELRSHIYRVLAQAVYIQWKERTDKKTGEVTLVRVVTPWNPDKRKVANVIEGMAAIGHLPSDIDQPGWIGMHDTAGTTATQIISCRNGLLDLATRKVHDHTPTFFNAVSVPFDYRLDATPPTAWLNFLASLWPDDPDSILLLQEYIGYVLSGRTDMQKMLMLIGPTRSGKGTIARVLTKLVGHVIGPTLASLGTNFGLAPLVGAPLAIISDARLGNIPDHTVVERLLSITGEDMITVDRKFMESWSGKMPVRFVILSNELPRFKDSSGAIANRMLILQMTKSYLNEEDHDLDAKLAGGVIDNKPVPGELAGILNWALEGLDRLIRNGRFTVPRSAEDAANLMMDLASPVSAFVRDRCVRNASAVVSRDTLYNMWKTWAEDNGHRPGAKSTFGRDLRAVVPELATTRQGPRDARVHGYAGIGIASQSGVQGVQGAQAGVQDDWCAAQDKTAGHDTRCPGCPRCPGKNGNTRTGEEEQEPGQGPEKSVSDRCNGFLPGHPGHQNETAGQGARDGVLHLGHPGHGMDEPDEPVDNCPECGFKPPPGRSIHFDCERKAAIRDCTANGLFPDGAA